jgi:Asp-tRNA(Asn)/Glu-tRNA(Gln) amidotransferase A subunit family amidase
MLGFDGGAIGADIYCDRTGILARSLGDCALIFDALKDPDTGYYDSRDVYTTVPRSSVVGKPFASCVVKDVAEGELEGIRLGVIRESMVSPPGSMAERPIVVAASEEIKSVLGARMGATLVESSDPLWEPDPDLEQMRVDFRDALARLVPVFMPGLMFRVLPDGSPLFAEFARAIRPTEFESGITIGGGSMDPIDWLVLLAEGAIEPPENLDIATVQEQILANGFRFHLSQYLSRRAADWRAAGFEEKLVDWSSLNQRSKFWGDDQRAAFENWAEVADPRNPLGGRQGVEERIMLRELLRRVDMMVMYENQLDAFVRLHTPWAPGLIGHPLQHETFANVRPESKYGPNAGLTEILVPAGYVTEAYDPAYSLSDDRTRYVAVQSDVSTELRTPGLPFSLVFRSEPGREDELLRIASAYEATSRRRISPPAFGALAEHRL